MKKNINLILSSLQGVLGNIDYEIIVVDDNSPDGTWDEVQQISARDDRVKLIRRIDEKGLSSAVVSGMASSTGAVIAVMDADMQHDEAILTDMFKAVISGRCDICIGSREAPGGSYGSWSAKRKFISYTAKYIANKLLGATASDPMSGYFALSRKTLDETINKVNPSGFKILLEFLARTKNPRVLEIGYKFRARQHGETKLNAAVAAEYLLALIDLRFGWLIPHRFVKFSMMGLTGSLVNFSGFALSQYFGLSITASAVVGIELAILWTYFGNNRFTFSPVVYKGSRYYKGLLFYQTISLYGLVIQLSVLHYLLFNWPILENSLLTTYFAYMVGVGFSALGNYLIHTTFTWNRLGFTLLKPSRKSLEVSRQLEV